MRSPGGSTGGWLGAPASVGGGLPLALTRGLAVGCSVVQIFLKNQRQWTARPYTDSEVREFLAAWKASGIRVVFAHASYLINLATPVPAEWHRAVDVFQDELERAEALGLPFVVIHPGSHRATGLAEGVLRAARARHEKIGRGHLGVEAFRLLMTDRRFARVPMALETPKDPEPRADRDALVLLRGLRRRARTARP